MELLSGYIAIPLPVYNGDPGTWKTLTNEFHNWAFSRNIEHTLTLNDTMRDNEIQALNLTDVQVLRAQKTLYIALHNAFKDTLPSYVNYPDRSLPHFATDLWKKIYHKMRPDDAISAHDLILQLNHATVFKGEMNEYIQKIRRLAERLANLGHAQSELVICSNIHSSILQFSSTATDELDRGWGPFISTLLIQAPGHVLTLDLIQRHGVLHERQLESARGLRQMQHSFGLLANPMCSYCNGPHTFTPVNCEKYRYDRKKRAEERGRSQSRDRERSEGRDYKRRRTSSREPSRGRSRTPRDGRPRSRTPSQPRYRGRSSSRDRGPRVDFGKTPHHGGEKRRCWNCNSERHLSKDCPFNGGSHGGPRDKSRSKSRDRAGKAYTGREGEPKKREGEHKQRSQERRRSKTPETRDKSRHSPHPYPRPSSTSLLALDAWSRQQGYEPIGMMARTAVEGESRDNDDGTLSAVVLNPRSHLSNISLKLNDWRLPTMPCQGARFATGCFKSALVDKDSFTRSSDPLEHHFIVDSGCNRHLVADERFIHRGELIQSSIRGLGDTVTATAQGPLLATMTDAAGRRRDILSWGLFIPDSRVSLFSVIQALLAGNHVVHEGNPATGRHGLFIPSANSFIPFIWCPTSGLFWIRLRIVDPGPVALHGDASRHD